MRKFTRENLLSLLTDSELTIEAFKAPINFNLLQEFKIKNKFFYKLSSHLPQSSFHHLLNNRFLADIPVSNAANAFVKGRSYLTFLAPHIRSYNFMRVDLSNFFHSITKEHVKSALSSHIEECYLDSKQTTTLLELLCNSVTVEVAEASQNNKLKGKCILPMGLKPSPFVSNVVFRKMDLLIDKLCRSHGILYTRYADDLLFSAPKNSNFIHSSRFINELSFLLSIDNFKINQKKTLKSKHTISINGYIIQNLKTLSNDCATLRISNKKTKFIIKFMHRLKKGGISKDQEVLETLFNYKFDANRFRYYPPTAEFVKKYCREQVTNKLQGYRSYLLSFHVFHKKNKVIDLNFLEKSSNLVKEIEKEINKRVGIQ